MSRDIQKLLKEMSLEEKAGLCSGDSWWYTKGIEHLDIPSIMMSDGPHGLRKQQEVADHLGQNESVEAICFPTGSALASSWDREIINKLGKALGEECQAENISILLGPGANIKRSPLCGRNFEYLSEDPYLASELTVSYIKGVQSMGVGTSENSIIHGMKNITQKIKKYNIRIIISLNIEGFLEIEIIDNGRGFPLEKLKYFQQRKFGNSNHIGIWNVYKRLKLNFGKQAELKFFNSEPGGAIVKIIIPHISDSGC